MIITLPKLGPVRFDDNLSPQDFRRQLQAITTKYGIELPKQQMGLGAIAGQGFRRGLGETGIAFGDVLPAMAYESLGAPKQAEQQMQEAAASREELYNKYPPRFDSYTKVKTAGDVPEFMAETLGEIGPSVLTSLVPGVGAGLTASRMAGQAVLKEAAKRGISTKAAELVAKQQANKAGKRAMYGGVYLGSFAQNTPEVFENIYQSTGKMEPGISALAGGISAVLDSLVPGQLLNQLGAFGRQKAVMAMAKKSGAAPKVLKYMGATAASTALKEGLTEAAQEAISAQAEKIAGSLKDVTHPDNIQRYKEAFVKGAVGGGAFGTVGGLSEGAARKSAYNDMVAQQAQQAAAQQAATQAPPAGPAPTTTMPPETPPVFTGAAPTEPIAPQGGGVAETAPVAGMHITPEVLDNLGISKATKLAKAIAELDLTKLDDLTKFTEAMGGPNVPTGIKWDAVNDLVTNAQAQLMATTPIAQPAPVQPEPTLRQSATEPVSGFVTAKGSEYVMHDDGTTVRNKAARPEHPGDSGIKKKSDLTLYVTPENADKLATPEGEWRVVQEKDGTLSVINKNKDGEWGYVPDSKKIGVSTTPEVGLNPIELWGKESIKGLPAYSNMHPGNEITEIKKNAIPEPVTGLDINDPESVAEVLRRADMVTNKADKAEINKLLDTVPRDVLAKALALTNEDVVDQQPQAEAQPTAQPTAPKPMVPPAPLGSLKSTLIPDQDIQNIVSKLGINGAYKGLSEQEKDARNYFTRQPNPDIALKSIANDLVHQPTEYRGESESFKGQGGKHAQLAAQWVRSNLSPEAVANFEKELKIYQDERKSAEKFLKKSERSQKRAKAEKKQLAEAKKQEEFDKLAEEVAQSRKSVADVIDESDEYYDDMTPGELQDIVNTGRSGYEASQDTALLYTQAHPAILHALEQGDIKGALRMLSESPSSEFAGRISRKLSDLMKGVGVTYGADKSSYNPEDNTISLRDGATEYEILHEAAHAALSHTVEQKSHPVTKQLQMLFNSIKDNLDGVYGAKNVQEFVAEAWSNPDFRRQLSETRVPDTNTSVWDRIVNALRRLLGFPPSNTTTLRKVDEMLNAIASPPPTARDGETLYAQAIHEPDLANRIWRGVDATVQKMPLMNDDRASKFMGGLEKLGDLGKKVMLKSLNLSALGQVSNKLLGKTGVEFSDTVNKISGYQERLFNKLLPLHKGLQKFAQSDRYKAWSTLVHDSTKHDVNPDRPRDYYKGSPERLAEYDGIKARFNKLLPEEKRLYRDLFAAYKALDKEFEESLYTNVKAALPDSKIAETAYGKILNELSTLRVDHYAPLYRKGTYWASYMLNGELHKPLFESRIERDKAIDAAKAQGATNIETYSNMDQITSKSVPDNTMISSIVKLLRDNGAGEEAIDQLAQLIVRSMPETSILKSRIPRKGVAGYMDDAAIAFDNVTSNTVHQLSRMKYGPQLSNLMKAMEEKGKQMRGADSDNARALIGEFEDRRRFVMKPDIAAWAQFASTGSFFYNLAFNVSSALVNTTQVPLVVLPQLAGEYGWAKASKMLWDAISLYTHSGFTRDVVDMGGQKVQMRSMLSVENLVNSGKAPQYARLMDKLTEFGFLQNSTARDAVMSADKPNSMMGSEHRLGYYVKLGGTFMFHHAERMNREITAIAAYDLEMGKLKNDKTMTQEQKETRAVDKAVRAVEYMHGAGHTDTGPSLGHSSLGKVLMVFKRFAFSMYYMLFDTAMRAFPIKGTPEQKEQAKIARRQLLGIYGMSSMFAGAKGLPMYWVAEAAYNALNDDDDEDFDTVARKYLGDMVFKGPLNYYTNLSIADRVGWTDLIFREARTDKADASTLSGLLESAFGAPYTMVNNMFRAKELAADGNIERAVETFLPVAFRNPLKAYRYSTEGVNTLRGDPVMGEVSGYNATMQALGFAPADLMLQFETNAHLKKFSKKLIKERDILAKKYYVAFREGDFERATEMKDKLFEFGDKHPELGISEEYLNRSVKTRDQISEDMYHGVSIPKRMKQSMIESAEEFN